MRISAVNPKVVYAQPAFARGFFKKSNHVSRKEKEKQDKILNEKAMLAMLALAGFENVQGIDKSELIEKLDMISKGEAPNQKQISKNSGDLSEIKRAFINAPITKHAGYFKDILLLKQNNVINRNSKKYDAAIKTIQNIGFEKLTSNKPLPIIEKTKPTIWSITSEFAPVKEGGLGSVPPEIRNNAEKLGVNVPTFLPMYLLEGKSSLVKTTDGYKYLYGKTTIPVQKLATIKMDVYKNAKPESIPVSYFLYTDKDEEGQERQLVFIHADDYFDGTIYEGNAKTEEPEKFAVMSKAVYEFAKLKMEGLKASKDVEVHNKYAYEEIKAPDAMILNDWQASPTAALLRYKAVMENAHGQISDETTQKLKDMAVITIGHNVMYQGSTQNDNDVYQKKVATSNILNTLFDKYAYDIVINAKSGAEKIDSSKEVANELGNVLVLRSNEEEENFTNFLNMGIILSDYFNPVSKNYAKELVLPQNKKLSYMLQWALVQKDKAGKLIGVINGNDYRNISIEKNKSRIKELTGVDFETYNKDSSIEEIQQKRLKNKIAFYNNFILPYSESKISSQKQINEIKKLTSKLEFYKGKQGTILPQLSDIEIEKTPILMSGGRLVSQKGMDILCDGLEMLFENWEKDFPGKNKPIIYIAGSDGEKGKIRKIIEELKNIRLSEEDNDRVLFAHGYAPMAAFMSACDFFLMPSKFEPCGLTQGEAFALATPVIASAVGGIVDTVNRDGKFNGVLTDKDEILSAEGYYEAMKKGLNIFFNDKETYKNMVQDSIAEDFSWAKNGEGPVFDYLNLLGIQK